MKIKEMLGEREREIKSCDSLAFTAVEVLWMNHLKFIDNVFSLDWKTACGITKERMLN